MTKVTCELRALEPGPESAGADGGPAGAASTKCCGLSAGEANAGTVLVSGHAMQEVITPVRDLIVHLFAYSTSLLRRR